MKLKKAAGIIIIIAVLFTPWMCVIWSVWEVEHDVSARNSKLEQLMIELAQSKMGNGYSRLVTRPEIKTMNEAFFFETLINSLRMADNLLKRREYKLAEHFFKAALEIAKEKLRLPQEQISKIASWYKERR